METSPEQQESPLVEEIKMLRDIVFRASDRDAKMERIMAFAGHLRANYPDCKRREAYHALAGSTMMEGVGEPITEDFPGDDSVLEFLRSLLGL